MLGRRTSWQRLTGEDDSSHGGRPTQLATERSKLCAFRRADSTVEDHDVVRPTLTVLRRRAAARKLPLRRAPRAIAAASRAASNRRRGSRGRRSRGRKVDSGRGRRRDQSRLARHDATAARAVIGRRKVDSGPGRRRRRRDKESTQAQFLVVRGPVVRPPRAHDVHREPAEPGVLRERARRGRGGNCVLPSRGPRVFLDISAKLWREHPDPIDWVRAQVAACVVSLFALAPRLAFAKPGETAFATPFLGFLHIAQQLSSITFLCVYVYGARWLRDRRRRKRRALLRARAPRGRSCFESRRRRGGVASRRRRGRDAFTSRRRRGRDMFTSA